MADRPSALERAFQLANSGKCNSVKEISIKLEAEGYEGSKQQLSGPVLRRQLTNLCIEAQKGR